MCEITREIFIYKNNLPRITGFPVTIRLFSITIKLKPWTWSISHRKLRGSFVKYSLTMCMLLKILTPLFIYLRSIFLTRINQRFRCQDNKVLKDLLTRPTLVVSWFSQLFYNDSLRRVDDLIANHPSSLLILFLLKVFL